MGEPVKLSSSQRRMFSPAAALSGMSELDSPLVLSASSNNWVSNGRGGWIRGQPRRMLYVQRVVRGPIGGWMSKREQDRALFEAAYAELSKELPEFLARALARLSEPGMSWLRIPLGIVFVVGGFLSFLPVLGIELLPLGALLLAHDVPALHRPVGTATLWLVERLRGIKSYAWSAWNAA